jgi:hypothetical protein
MVSRKLPSPANPHRKREVNGTRQLRRFILNTHQNAFAYNSNDRTLKQALMFLIRCAFWLTIVFTSLPWPQDAQLQSQKLLADAAASLIRSAGGHADISAQQCLAAPQACVEQTRKVQALFEAAAKAEQRRARPAS